MKKSLLIGISISTIGVIILSGTYFIFSKKNMKVPQNVTTQIEQTSKTFTEFLFYEIAPRSLYGGLGDNSGPIGEVTSFYMTATGVNNMNYDFEIMETGIADIFIDRKGYIQRIGDTEIKICTQESGGRCFIEKSNLVETFIKRYGL